MRQRLALAVLIVLTGAACAPREPDPTVKVLASRGTDKVVEVNCRDEKTRVIDEGCAGIEVRKGAVVTWSGPGGYLPAGVDLVWQGEGGPGPDAVIRGDYGGSGGGIDLLTIDFEGKPVVRTLFLGHAGDLHMHSAGGLPAFDAPFDLMGVQGASNAATTTVPIPVSWTGERFEPDLAALAVRPAPEIDKVALRAEIAAHNTDMDGMPRTLEAIAPLILAGRADEVRRLLAEVWPKGQGGRDAYWREVALAMTSHPLWMEFDLDRIAHADLLRF